VILFLFRIPPLGPRGSSVGPTFRYYFLLLVILFLFRIPPLGPRGSSVGPIFRCFLLLFVILVSSQARAWASWVVCRFNYHYFLLLVISFLFRIPPVGLVSRLSGQPFNSISFSSSFCPFRVPPLSSRGS
ncbi:unnamed protein product, partial [Ectocarpus sp. 4 AP-2014]